MKRVVTITLENDVMDDNAFYPEVARVLSELGRMVGCLETGNRALSYLVSGGGTRVLMLGGGSTEECIARSDPGPFLQHLQS